MGVLRFHKTSGQAEVGESNPLPVALAGGDAENPGVVTVPMPATFYHGQKTVAAAGTAEALGASQELTSGVTIKALPDNQGVVYIGKSDVDSSNGYVLSAGEAVLIITDNVADVYVDAAQSGDGVCWIGS